MAPRKVILLACGSFNPPTNMHLRMFELARDNLNRLGQYLVIGGIVSPVHEAYGKKELIPGPYRCEMLKLALQSSDWIQISDWECTQETWSRTRRVLQYHQNLLNSVLSDEGDSPNNNQRNELENGYDYCNWITNDIRNTDGPVQIKLLCGADLLESFATPGLWTDEDVETIIGQHGIVVITRQGSDPRRFIYESDILTKYQHNIVIVTEWITNDVSSTKVRRALRRQESVKYLLEDSVIEFIKKHGLYGTTKKDVKYSTNINKNLSAPPNTYILTPSPSDVNIMSESTSGTDLYLALKPISKETETPDADIISPAKCNVNSTFQTFQSTYEIRFTNRNENVQARDSCERPNRVGSDGVQASEAVVSLEPALKKVGLPKPDGRDGELAEKAKGREQKRPSKKYGKGGAQGKRLAKADSEQKEERDEDEVQPEKENLLLRRSKSDAVMSRRRQDRGTGSNSKIKIQFTKDGVKVISDKESIV